MERIIVAALMIACARGAVKPSRRTFAVARAFVNANRTELVVECHRPGEVTR
jgi:hypothetical protein